jgi:hypothetical protein
VQLGDLDRAYFAKDKHKLMKSKLDEIIALLNTKPLELGKAHILRGDKHVRSSAE